MKSNISTNPCNHLFRGSILERKKILNKKSRNNASVTMYRKWHFFPRIAKKHHKLLQWDYRFEWLRESIKNKNLTKKRENNSRDTFQCLKKTWHFCCTCSKWVEQYTGTCTHAPHTFLGHFSLKLSEIILT